MNVLEKIYSSLAIIFTTGLIICLIFIPDLRLLNRLIPLSLLGLVINTVLIFIVLRDILSRRFRDERSKYLWLALILFFWPSLLFYLPKYGFRPRA